MQIPVVVTERREYRDGATTQCSLTLAVAPAPAVGVGVPPTPTPPTPFAGPGFTTPPRPAADVPFEVGAALTLTLAAAAP